MADETRQIQVLMGPYRDNRLTVSAADAESAINNHWAVDPFELPDPDHQHPPLSEEERLAAMTAANDWATAQWDAAQGNTPPPPDPPVARHASEAPATEKRDMTPEDTSGDYTTRDHRRRR